MNVNFFFELVFNLIAQSISKELECYPKYALNLSQSNEISLQVTRNVKI